MASTNSTPEYVYILTSTIQDTEGRHGHEEAESTEGVFESVEDANEYGINLLKDYYKAGYYKLKEDFIERWTEEEYISYDSKGCLIMEDYPEEV